MPIVPDSMLGVVTSTVTDKLRDFKALSDRYNESLSGSLFRISDIRVDDVPPPQRLPVPDMPSLSFHGTPPPSFSPSSLSIPSAPVLADFGRLLDGLEINPSDWDLPDRPVAPIFSLPPEPALRDISAPERPTVNFDVRIPDAPVWVVPELDSLAEYGRIPELPLFDGRPPNADGIAVPDVFLDWHEPVYRSELLDELVAQVREMMRGGTGLPPIIEDALFSRARERESAENERQVQEVVQLWAARGFSLPQGALDKQISVIREQGRLKSAELNRDILVQAATWEIENLRFAVQQGIALEQLTANLYENMAGRLFEAARFSAESQINVFNARVSLFNAQAQAFGLLGNLYQAKLTAFKAAVDAELAKGEMNRQKIDVFRAKLEAVQLGIEQYKTMMQAAGIRADIVARQLYAYRTDVQAFAERVAAEKVKLDVYSARIGAEKSKADMFHSQVQAYAATVQAVSSQADIHVKAANVKTDAAKAHIQKFLADVDAFKAQLQASLSGVQFETQVFQAQVDAWRAQSSVAVSEAEMQAKYAETASRTNIAYSQMLQEEYRANIQNAINKAQLALEAAKALGQYHAQLAAGALSAQHVSASMSASGSVSSSESKSTSTSHNYSY